MNFDLPSLKDSLKELNNIHNKEIYTVKENKHKYTVYKNNKVYFKGNKNSAQDYAKVLLYLLMSEIMFEILCNGEN